MKTLRKIKRVMDKIFGTRSDELFWRFRHLQDRSWPASYISKETLNHPHRQLLVEKISSLAPFETALEVGSASGPNLYLLAKKFPQAKFYGIDISRKAVARDREFFREEGIENVHLEHANADVLKRYGEKSMDIVFSDVTLMYIGPDKMNKVAGNMARVARKALILCEQHTEQKPFYEDKWVHNWRVILTKFFPENKITFTKISKELWSGGAKNNISSKKP